jgi:hypothetical protein
MHPPTSALALALSGTRPRRGRAPTVAVALLMVMTTGAGAQATPPSVSASAADERTTALPADCFGPGRRVIVTPRGTITGKYSPDPPSDTTFDARRSTWRPNLSTYPIGLETTSSRICWYDGAVYGSIPADMTWERAHSYNQPCVRIVARDWIVLDGIRCDNTDDGFRPRETSIGAQNVTMVVRNTYFTRIHDDCIENDDVIGGLLQDNLWNGCNTGISEQPTGRSFSQPAGERLVLDHMLMGLWITPHEEGPGENSLFKWSSSANKVVIRCSVFKVDAASLNGAKAMAVPATIDDSACPDRPTTIVWLGGGPYLGDLPSGIRVTSNLGVWTRAVSAWKCAHGYKVIGC